MNRENYLQLMASFMVSLVLTIPLITSANASIDRVVVKGSDGIEGFARSTDSLDFSVDVTYPNMTPGKLYLGSQFKFDKCSVSKDNITVCTLKYPKTGKENFGSRPLPFTINLFKDESKQQVVASEAGTVLVDSKAPEAKLSIAKNIYSGKEKITVNYEANDFSCDDAECSGKCTGFKGIEIKSADNSFKQSVNPNSTDCSVKSSITIEANKFKDGGNSLLITASDKFNQISSEESVSFTLDATPPKILPETFKIFRKGILLNSYSNFDVPVEVILDVQASDLDTNSVFADFSPLNPTKSMKNLKGACALLKDDIFRCKWSIEINAGRGTEENLITGAQTADTRTLATADTRTTASPETTRTSTSSTARASASSITVNVSDKIGNSASATISKSLTLDDKGPAIQSLTAGMEKDGKLYSKQLGNTVTAIFLEATYMFAEETFLHVNANKIAATSCKKDSNWVCKWQNVDFGNTDKATLTVKEDTVDFLLNPVAEPKSIEIIVDTKAPALKGSISVVPQGSLSDKYPELIKVGDKLLIEANITEDNDLFAFADFSKFIDNAKNVAGSCSRLEDKSYKCTWTTEVIKNSGTNNLKFNFSDFVGNSIQPEKQLKVLGLDEAFPPDYWQNTFKCSPEFIDRQLGPFINQRMYCSVKLEPKVSGNPIILTISDAVCTGSQIIEKYETINNEAGSRSPIIKFTLKKDEFKIDSSEVKCTFNIISRRGDAVTKNPEPESVNITIKFYNQPLGEISEELENKITKAKEDAQGIWKKIGTWNKIVKYAKTICQFINTIYLAASAIYSVWLVLNGIAHSGIGSFAVPASVSSCVSSEGAGKAADGFKTATNKFCDYITCSKTILWGDKVKNFIDNLPGGTWVGPTTQQVRDEERAAEEQKKGQKEQEKAAKDQANAGGQGGAQTGSGNSGPVEFDFVRNRFLGQKPLSEYIDYRNNLMAATLFACIPGIIAGLDKYRQIKCLYADCLQTAVAQEGLPVTSCEDLKRHATCKYIWGEIFAVIPYTALFDHFTGIIKDALSNPFTALSLSASVYCTYFCKPGDAGIGYATCRGFRIFSLLGDSVENVKNMVNEGFTIRQDYCARLEPPSENNNEEDEEDNSGTSSANTRTQSRTRTNPQQGTRG